MLELLDEVLLDLPTLIDAGGWETLVINRRKPHTYRAFLQHGGLRICLHRFEECDANEAFPHPHPWPGAFKILSGSYEMGVGFAKDRESLPGDMVKLVLAQGSSYEIVNPLVWHYVRPLGECFTVMVNDVPWAPDVAHKEVRTTRGKDLEQMDPEQRAKHFEAFKRLLGA
jgi:hypothetical protein